MTEIPSKFENEILQFPECSYGVTCITVTLDTGEIIRDVFVAWGREIVRVGDSEKVSFDPKKIIAIKHQ